MTEKLDEATLRKAIDVCDDAAKAANQLTRGLLGSGQPPSVINTAEGRELEALRLCGVFRDLLRRQR